eukprot:COSAG06_NODE_60071_length_272_cov_0.595376_1_plen_58_part_10
MCPYVSQRRTENVGAAYDIDDRNTGRADDLDIHPLALAEASALPIHTTNSLLRRFTIV